jgi:predicted transcriptional regulator
MILIPGANFIHKGRQYKFGVSDRLFVEDGVGGWKLARDPEVVIEELKLANIRSQYQSSSREYGALRKERVEVIADLVKSNQVMTALEISDEMGINIQTVRECLKVLKGRNIIAPNYYKFIG